MARWLALPLVLAPAIALAAPLPPEDVAPEAVPQAPPPPQYANPYAPPQYANPYAPPQYANPYAPPQYDYSYGQPGPNAPPPPAYPPPYGYGCAQYCQPACPPQPTCCPSCAPGHAAVPDGWRVVIGDDGAWYREREVKKGNAGLIATGLVLWLGSWMGTGWGGLMADGSVGAVSFVPFMGPFISGAIQATGDKSASAMGYMVAGLVQVTGFVLFVSGASSKHVVHERKRITWGAGPTQNGFAANLTLRF
jgi:hypothetical protein